jgi:hypothetical protein
MRPRLLVNYILLAAAEMLHKDVLCQLGRKPLEGSDKSSVSGTPTT